MVKNDGATTKNRRVKELHRHVIASLKRDDEVPLDYVVAWSEYEQGLSTKVARGYVEILKRLQFIDINEDTGMITNHEEEGGRGE